MELKFKDKHIRIYQDLIEELRLKGYKEQPRLNFYQVDTNQFSSARLLELHDNGVGIKYPYFVIKADAGNEDTYPPDGVSWKYATEDGSAQTYKEFDSGNPILTSQDGQEIIMRVNANGFNIEDLAVFEEDGSVEVLSYNEEQVLKADSNWTEEPYRFLDYEKVNNEWDKYFDDYMIAMSHMHALVEEDGFDNLTKEQKDIVSLWRVILQSKNTLSMSKINNTMASHEMNKVKARNKRFSEVYVYVRDQLTQDELNVIMDDVNSYNFREDYIFIGRMGTYWKNWWSGEYDNEGILDYTMSNGSFNGNGLGERISSISGTAKQQFIGAIFNKLEKGTWT